jgi:hypothetical protein
VAVEAGTHKDEELHAPHKGRKQQEHYYPLLNGIKAFHPDQERDRRHRRQDQANQEHGVSVSK